MDKAVNFFSIKYDEIEKANRHLEGRVIQLESEKKEAQQSSLRSTGRSRRYLTANCLTVHGLKEDKDELKH